jgi:hypothetical protein
MLNKLGNGNIYDNKIFLKYYFKINLNLFNRIIFQVWMMFENKQIIIK